MMAEIKDVATSIKQTLGGRGDCDLEFLAQLFEDNTVSDTGSGNELANRLTTILAASSDGTNNGVTHFAGIYQGCRDRGFRTDFKDPWPGASDNQVGHFTTAVDMGFRPMQTFGALPWWARAVSRLFPRSIFVSDSWNQQFTADDISIRAIIGHEQVADDAPNANHEAVNSATEHEVTLFQNALGTVTSALNQDPNTTRTALNGIRIGSGRGNSMQDLLLSCFGYRFGQMIRSGTINDRPYAAKWIRSNIGGSLPQSP
jgi:hypothetical protein